MYVKKKDFAYVNPKGLVAHMAEIIGSLAVAITVLFGLIALFKVVFWEDKFHEDGPDKLVHKD